MRLLISALLVLVLAGLTSCGEDRAEGDSSTRPSDSGTTADADAVVLPDNLCEDILPVLSPDWGFTEDSHRTDELTSECKLTDASGATTLDVSLTLADDLDAALKTACEERVEPAPEGQEDRRCTSKTETGIEQAAKLTPRGAVLYQSFSTDDPDKTSLAGADLASVEYALETAD